MTDIVQWVLVQVCTLSIKIINTGKYSLSEGGKRMSGFILTILKASNDRIMLITCTYTGIQEPN